MKNQEFGAVELNEKTNSFNIMPVEIKKVDGYRVSTPGGVKAKRTTKKKAEAQKRLLHGVEHGWEPTGKPAKEHPEGKAVKSYGGWKKR